MLVRKIRPADKGERVGLRIRGWQSGDVLYRYILGEIESEEGICGVPEEHVFGKVGAERQCQRPGSYGSRRVRFVIVHGVASRGIPYAEHFSIGHRIVPVSRPSIGKAAHFLEYVPRGIPYVVVPIEKHGVRVSLVMEIPDKKQVFSQEIHRRPVVAVVVVTSYQNARRAESDVL